jgi:EF hand
MMVPQATLLAKTPSPKKKILAKYDTNKNGKLDADEIEVLRKDFAASPDGELKPFDSDGDGKLSDTEIVAIAGDTHKKSSKKKGAEKSSDSAPVDGSATAPKEP